MKFQQRRLHSRVWMVLSLLLPLLIVVVIATRQNGPFEKPAEPLDDRAKEILNTTGG